MTNKQKSKKQKHLKILAAVSKEMSRPRLAESVRKQEEEADHRGAKYDNFLNA